MCARKAFSAGVDRSWAVSSAAFDQDLKTSRGHFLRHVGFSVWKYLMASPFLMWRCSMLSSSLLSSLELSGTQVYEPQIRALLGTTSHFCQVVVLKLYRMASPYLMWRCVDEWFRELSGGLSP